MDSITTRYGRIGVQNDLELYPDGSVRALTPCAGTVTATPLGTFAPRHDSSDERTKTGASLEFHPDGALRSIILKTRSAVATPAGEVLAEQLIFHPCGALARVFPLCGRTSAYWAAEDEIRLMEPFFAATPCGGITAKFMSLAFDVSGRMRSLTLWPGEMLDLATPAGRMPVRIGAAFYPDGSLRSVEPGRPTPVETPVGRVLAFDPDATGITGDVNSLGFTPAGRLSRVSVVRTMLGWTDHQGERREIRPTFRESLCGNADTEPVAMRLTFGPQGLTLRRTPDEPEIAWSVTAHDAPQAVILPPEGLFASMGKAACHGAPASF
jgi:hypothetical protein